MLSSFTEKVLAKEVPTNESFDKLSRLEQMVVAEHINLFTNTINNRLTNLYSAQYHLTEEVQNFMFDNRSLVIRPEDVLANMPKTYDDLEKEALRRFVINS
jgi:hypothetical protein